MPNFPPCVNLKQLFGDRYKISFDPAAETWGNRRDPWLMQIPCRYGTIYPHGGDVLAIDLTGRNIIANRLSALPCCRVYNWGEDDRGAKAEASGCKCSIPLPKFTAPSFWKRGAKAR